ncbi:MAG: IS66 family transposase [Planctomycetota bacterium]|jgi:transposase|nr:IS66 family transposase [Planctomycetota bacterium]
MSACSISPEKQTLPDDVAILQGMIASLSDTVDKQNQTIERLKHELLLLRYWRFGRKSEKLEENGQLNLFGDVAAMEETSPAEPDPLPVAVKQKGHGRKSIPSSLPVERVVIEPSPEELVCQSCGADKVRIGEEVRKELDYNPGSVFVREIVRPVCACPKECEGQVVVAENPPSPIEKGLPGPGLLAHVAVQKYSDHIPLNRQEAMLRRHGVDIRRSTLSDWMAEAAHLLLSFNEVVREEVLLSHVIHVDETPVTVQDPKGKAKPHLGRVWTYIGDRKHPYIFFDYSPDRKALWPERMLSGWSGFLQADAYRGYDSLLDGKGIVEVACWAHARRKLVEAEKSNRLPALEGLVHIRELYRVEKDIREECGKLGYSLADPGKKGDLAAELRQRRRQEQSMPLLDAFGEWLKGRERIILPKSPLGEAMSYCRNNWAALTVYASDGELSIDNNPAERTLRPVAVGRKNYLFFGSDKGGETAAVLYGVIASAKRHGLDPWRYLRDLLTRLPAMTVSGLRELLPDRWKAGRDGGE